MLNKKEPLYSGFTIIELLFVVVIISIISGVFISGINYRQKMLRAADSAKKGNVLKIVEGIEAYRIAEGSYPLDSNGDGTPMEDGVLTVYLNEWPDGSPEGAVYSYWSSGAAFGLVVSIQDGDFYKYRSEWAEIRYCGATVASNNLCPTPNADVD